MVTLSKSSASGLTFLPFESLQQKHDRIIGALPDRYWLVKGKFTDHVWTIQTDSGQVRNGEQIVRFDPIIAPDLRSSDLEDIITAKLLVYYGLGNGDGRYQTASTIPLLIRSYFQFVRWRVSKGLYCNSELTPDWINLLLQDLSLRGIVDLPPYDDRIAVLRERIANGHFEVPFYIKGRRRIARVSSLCEAIGAPNAKALPRRIEVEIDQIILDQGMIPSDRGNDRKPPKSANDDREDPAALSETRIITFLTPLQLLHVYREHLTHDQISFSPFDGEKGTAYAAKGIARVDRRRSLTVPAYQGCFLVDNALTWITTYFVEIKDFLERLNSTMEKYNGHWRPHEAAFLFHQREDNERYSDQPGSWWPIHPTYFPPQGSALNIGSQPPSFRMVLFEFLASAAIIVIAAFAARRREEVDSLTDNCIKTEDGEYWLECWISKNIQSTDRIPVPPSVVQAVEVLKWLSEKSRKLTSDRWICSFADVIEISGKQKKTFGYDVYRSLDRFAEFVGVPTIGGERWVPKPTQYRRFFGMVYFHRFDFPSLIALSNFYRHYNPARTRGYILEISYGSSVRRAEEKLERASRKNERIERFSKDRRDDFLKSGHEFRMKVIADAVTGEDYLRGFGGETIMSDFARASADFKNRIQIKPEDPLNPSHLNSLLREFTAEMWIEPHPAGHSYCKCTSKQIDLGAAACLRKRHEIDPHASLPSGPDLAFATPDTCAGCVHNLQRACNSSWWQETLDHEEHQREHALTPFLREVASARAEVASKLVQRCHADPAKARW